MLSLKRSLESFVGTPYIRNSTAYSGFFIRQAVKRLKEILTSVPHGLEWYFLGTKPTHHRGLGPGCVSLDEKDVYENLLVINDREENNVFKSLKMHGDLGEKVSVVFIMPSLMIPNLAIKNKDLENRSVLMTPHNLEMVPAMIECIIKEIPEQILVILAHLSMLPSEKEVHLSFSNSENTHYERAYKKMLYAVLQLQRDQPITIAVIDQEITLGKKNSALLRRIFTNKITK